MRDSSVPFISYKNCLKEKIVKHFKKRFQTCKKDPLPIGEAFLHHYHFDYFTIVLAISPPTTRGPLSTSMTSPACNLRVTPFSSTINRL